MISVIIPLYNKEKHIKDTINSVLVQTYKNFELIIVNDGSTDGSGKIVNEYNDSRIRIIDKVNEGVSAARNAGIENSIYSFISLIDADDLWKATFLEEMVSFISEFPDASLYGSGYELQYQPSLTIPANLGIPNDFKGYLDYFNKAKDNTLYTSSSVVFRKEDFHSIGGFDNTLKRGEDIDLWIKFALQKKLAFFNKPLVIYKLNSSNRASDKLTPKEYCLIWNLNRFKKYELHNQVFKSFLDNWRLAHISNYLNCTSTEVDDICPLLQDMDLKNRSIIWFILKYTPKLFQRIVYKSWIIFKQN